MEQDVSPLQQEIPLAAGKGGRYALSDELLQAVGPIWRSDGWEVKKFVAQVISHLDDGSEHLLDVEADAGDPVIFDVRLDVCTHLAHLYATEFLPVTPQWLRSLFRAKLETVRIPVALVREARSAYLSAFDPVRFLSGVLKLQRQEGIASTSLERLHTQSLRQTPESVWPAVEELMERMLKEGRINDEVIWHILYTDAYPTGASSMEDD